MRSLFFGYVLMDVAVVGDGYENFTKAKKQTLRITICTYITLLSQYISMSSLGDYGVKSVPF